MILTSTESVTATTTTDTISISVPTNFAPAGTESANGGTPTRVEFELGDGNAGSNTLDFLTPLYSPTYIGTGTYGNQTSTFDPTGQVTLSNNDTSLSVYEGLYTENRDNIDAYNVRAFSFSVTYANVPEPSTWALLGLGAVGVGVVALRRRRAVV